MRFRTLIFGLLLCLELHAQFKPEPGTGSLQSRYDRAAWKSPETLVSDLRSSDNGVRSKALLLMGYPGEQEVEVPTPDEIDLRYAAIGDDTTLDAVVSIVVNSVLVYSAVAVPSAGHWERVGVFNCWCKYENNPLRAFVDIRTMSLNRLQPVLVLRPSGGGTGAYLRDEAYFAVHEGGLRKLFTFQSYSRECPGFTEACTIETRSFSNRTLVESRQQVSEKQDRKNTCTLYDWDDETYRYKAISRPKPCASLRRP